MHCAVRALPVIVLAAVALNGCAVLGPVAVPRAEVEAVHSNIALAYSKCDQSAFVSAYANAFTFTTSNTKQVVTTIGGLRAYLAYGCGLSPNPTATVKQQSIRIVGAQAIATGQYLFRVPAEGKVVDLVQNFTVVFAREQDSWKVVAHHVSVAP